MIDRWQRAWRCTWAGLALGLALSGCEARKSTPTIGPAQLRILPASSSAADLVCSLFDPSEVAALPEQAFEYSLAHGAEGGWDALPRFSAYLAEQVLAREPNWVVLCPWQSSDTTERLREAGVQIHVLPEINDLAAARSALLRLGEVFGRQERALRLDAELGERVARLASQHDGRRALRTLCYSNFGAQGWTAGSGTTIDEIMRLAGVKNLVAEEGKDGHRMISFEELIQSDPELILVGEPLSYGAGPSGDKGGASEALLRSDPVLSGLRAVRTGRIVSLPAWLFATGSHEMVTAAETLAERVDAMLAREESAR